jgi:hypothetical protein
MHKLYKFKEQLIYMNIINNHMDPYLIQLNEHINNKNGKLVCINTSDINMTIKRVFYIYGFSLDIKDNIRGNHAHKNTTQIICNLHGSVKIYTKQVSDIRGIEKCFILNSPHNCLVLPPNNFIRMEEFTHDSIMLVLCDTEFNEDVYIY